MNLYTAKEYTDYLKIIRNLAEHFEMTPQEIDLAIWQKTEKRNNGNMEHSKTYREYIVQTINTLVECDNQIFTEELNLLMNNELKENDEVFEKGDIWLFR